MGKTGVKVWPETWAHVSILFSGRIMDIKSDYTKELINTNLTHWVKTSLYNWSQFSEILLEPHSKVPVCLSVSLFQLCQWVDDFAWYVFMRQYYHIRVIVRISMTGCESQYYVTGVSLRDPIIKDTKDFDVSHLILLADTESQTVKMLIFCILVLPTFIQGKHISGDIQ